MSNLTYDELKLGEKAKEAFLQGLPAEEIVKLPTYINTEPVFANLNVTDLATAAVLGGLNVFFVGDTGTGKSQIAFDIYRRYFGGNKHDNGQGVLVRGNSETDMYSEIFTKLNLSVADRELTDAISSLVFLVDEINRCPSVAQNQFLSLDGVMDYKGKSISLGRDGYNILMATANIGNGEFKGTFEIDKALYNRLHVVLDFDYTMLKPTIEDEMIIDVMRAANPKVKYCETKDISLKILAAYAEIEKIAENPGIEALAIVNYLRFGLENCMQYGTKEKNWPMNCQDCTHNKKSNAMCSLVKAPVRRTTEAMVKYASAMQFLAKLKNPEQEIDCIDLMFKAFELTGAYQFLLNEHILATKYSNANPNLMSEVVEMLKQDFRENEGFIMASIEELLSGQEVTSFFKKGAKIGKYDDLSDEAKKNVTRIEPYTDQRQIGLAWMHDFIKISHNLQKIRK